ncbi:hypothetical protein GEMRC1_007169 [Eukaryota sp. GEM-RC1]
MSISVPEGNPEVFNKAVNRFRDRNIILPTFEELRNPEKISQSIKDQLKELDPQANNPETGLYGDINYLELPTELTGVKAKIYVLLGKYFPSGSHKIGASYGPLVSQVTTGRFDPETQAALWPSTGNYCRGGAFNCALMDCKAIAVLPEEMSPERFNWLKEIGSEIYATPGCESNVREIFEKTEELIETGKGSIVAFNQFSDLSNPLFHYYCTGDAIREVFEDYAKDPTLRMSGFFSCSGSAGTLAAGDYLKERFPQMKIAVGEAIQCPTILNNGFGGHRIEGIGDKHIPWVHNVRNTDVAVGLDDEDSYRLLRLFNTEEGRKYLKSIGIDAKLVDKLEALGVSSIANVIGCIKMAKFFEMDESDCLFTVATDSAAMYQSRIDSEAVKFGEMTPTESAVIHSSNMLGIKIDYVEELTYYAKKRIHNLKYYTWIEQRGMQAEDLDAQWFDREFYLNHWKLVEFYDQKIKEFNKATGLIKE